MPPSIEMLWPSGRRGALPWLRNSIGAAVTAPIRLVQARARGTALAMGRQQR
jgi:hypothetical protein